MKRINISIICISTLQLYVTLLLTVIFEIIQIFGNINLLCLLDINIAE